jgi:uncharacterized protein YfdQ (DUF2303 family)
MHNNETQSAINAGLLMASPRKVHEEGVPFVVRPTDSVVESVEEYMPNPVRIKQTITLHDGASFIEYVKQYREPSTAIFFNEPQKKFVAVLDYHEGNGAGTEETETSTLPVLAVPSPRWCEHVATFMPHTTPEWDAWMQANGRRMAQVEFGEFIENHIEDVAEGFGPALLKIALTLEIKNTVSFTSHQKLEDGSVKFHYEEDVQGTASVGQLTIPAAFYVELQPFKGGPEYRVECRLRYRLVNRAVQFWYEISHPEEVIEAALNRVRAGIEEATGIGAFAGEYR